MSVDPELVELDRRLVATAKNIHILGSLAWPQQTIAEFLDGWARGEPKLPSPPVPRPPDESTLEALQAVAASERDDPWGRFLLETAQSYLGACDVILHAGTPRATEASIALYGLPSDPLPGCTMTHREAAEQLLEVTGSLVAVTRDEDNAYCIAPEVVAKEMRAAFADFFGAEAPRVEIDPELAAKAAASAKRIRLRAATCFSEDDIGQLVQHEALVHSATALNGRAQPHVTALSLSAPRTTATQEGLATLAELRSGVMDLARLRRLALRVVAIDLALGGADFVEVFRFFLDAGQSVEESAQSAARVFRGGDVHGRHVFTKDVVYLRGLFAVHTFCRRAIAEARPELVRRLFVGRLTLLDVLRFDPLFADGTIAPPRFVPPWAAKTRSLAAYLSFTGVLGRIELGAVDWSAL